MFLRWTFLRAVFHRGYVLASGLYFVVTAHLSAAQLVLLGAVMALTLLLSDIPAGVWSDAFSRKWPLVIGHGFLAAGMMLTGAVTTFGWLLVTQVLWGLGWAFSSGADVAWLTDELGQPGRIDRTLTARAHWELTGGATGMIAFGVLGWAAGLGPAIVASGAGMALLGAFVAARFGEDNFTPVRQRRWTRRCRYSGGGSPSPAATAGPGDAHRDHAPQRGGRDHLAVPSGLSTSAFPVNWCCGTRRFACFPSRPGWSRCASSRRGSTARARRGEAYVLACFIGALGLIVLAYAPDALAGGAGVLLARGISFNVTRAVSVIWVNRRTTSDVRTTMHSFLSQAESAGEIVGGVRARRPGPGRRDLRDAAHLGRAHRGDRRPGRPVAGWCAIGVSPAAHCHLPPRSRAEV